MAVNSLGYHFPESSDARIKKHPQICRCYGGADRSITLVIVRALDFCHDSSTAVNPGTLQAHLADGNTGWTLEMHCNAAWTPESLLLSLPLPQLHSYFFLHFSLFIAFYSQT